MEDREGQVKVFNYVTVPNASTYRSIMDVFLDAKQRYVIELRHSAVVEAVDQPDLNVPYHLDQLVRWGNLSRSHDTSTVSRIDDFYRRRHRFHLTSAGEAAHRAVREVESKMGTAGALRTSMLISLRDTLRALSHQSRSPAPSPERLVRLLHDLNAAFDPLTSEATRFIGELSQHIAAERVEEERFVLYKRALLAYVSRFIDELRRTSNEIADLIPNIASEPSDLRRLLEIASPAADLPPGADGEDRQELWIATQLERFQGVRAWFVGDGAGGSPTVERLSEVAVSAVVELTRSLGRLNDRRGRPVDRAADFKILARWMTSCDSSEEAHRIFHRAFGLHASRHLYVAEEDAELTSKTTSWWDAPTASVPLQLRTQGSLRRSGGPSKVEDHSDTKRWVAQLRRRERERAEAALGRFVGRGDMRLSELGDLGEEELEVFLSLIDETLTCPPDDDGLRRSRTADGLLEVTLRPPRADDHGMVTIVTPRGRISCHDYLLEVAERHRRPALRHQPSTGDDEAALLAREEAA